MLLTVAATAFTFTACNDDNDGPEPFKSELIGSYKPTPVTMTIPDVVDILRIFISFCSRRGPIRRISRRSIWEVGP